MIDCDDAIRDIVKHQPKKWFAKNEIVSLINGKYPGKWKESTIRVQIYACCVNMPSAKKQFPSSPKFLFKDKGKYQLYDPQVHTSESLEMLSRKGSAEAIEDQATLTLEKDLEENIARNLDQIERGLRLYHNEGVRGRQFNTDVGKIDLLTLDSDNNFVVIELKAGTATDSAVGQLLGYMNWIRKNVAGGKRVKGIIIADDFDTRLRYAVSDNPLISLKKYEVHFTFKDVKVE